MNEEQIDELIQLELRYTKLNQCPGCSDGDECYSCRPVSFHLSMLDALRHRNRFGLSNAELLAIAMLTMKGYDIINGNEGSGAFLRDKLLAYLDNALIKLPICNADPLYRQDRYANPDDYTIGNTSTWNRSLTASLEDFETNSGVKFLITPLPEELTRAHCIYELYDVNIDNCDIIGEYQVNFRPRTHFMVIDKNDRGGFVEINLQEIP